MRWFRRKPWRVEVTGGFLTFSGDISKREADLAVAAWNLAAARAEERAEVGLPPIRHVADQTGT